MPNPFRVNFFFINSIPGLSLRSNPGLKLANAFGVSCLKDELEGELHLPAFLLAQIAPEFVCVVEVGLGR